MRNTDLLQISVLSTDPQEAADIANKIVAVYQSTRVDEEKEIMNRAVASMNEEVAKQQKKVDEASTEVARIRDEEGIVDLNPEGMEDAHDAGQQHGHEAGRRGERCRDAGRRSLHPARSRSKSSRAKT